MIKKYYTFIDYWLWFILVLSWSTIQNYLESIIIFTFIKYNSSCYQELDSKIQIKKKFKKKKIIEDIIDETVIKTAYELT